MKNRVLLFMIPFMIYSYLGATLEHISYFIRKSVIPEKHQPKALANAIITGFPLYGIGAYIVVAVSTLLRDACLPLQFIIYASALSLLEYLAGVYTGAGKNSYTNNGHVESWDYSKERFNFDGKVSLRHFISWGILGLLVTWIHPIIMKQLRCC